MFVVLLNLMVTPKLDDRSKVPWFSVCMDDGARNISNICDVTLWQRAYICYTHPQV